MGKGWGFVVDIVFPTVVSHEGTVYLWVKDEVLLLILFFQL